MDAVARLPAGTSLLLHQEKSNPVDPNAVEVLSLHGALQLLCRLRWFLFEYCTFSCVASVTQCDTNAQHLLRR